MNHKPEKLLEKGKNPSYGLVIHKDQFRTACQALLIIKLPYYTVKGIVLVNYVRY